MDELEQFAEGVEAAMRPLATRPTETWTRGRGIALVHADSGDSLGNFVEYVHPSGARRLVREVWPTAIAATEYVRGPLGVSSEHKINPMAAELFAAAYGEGV